MSGASLVTVADHWHMSECHWIALDKQVNYFFTVALLGYAWLMPLHLAQMNPLEANSGAILDPVLQSEHDKLPGRLVTLLGFTDNFTFKLVLE